MFFFDTVVYLSFLKPYFIYVEVDCFFCSKVSDHISIQNTLDVKFDAYCSCHLLPTNNHAFFPGGKRRVTLGEAEVREYRVQARCQPLVVFGKSFGEAGDSSLMN